MGVSFLIALDTSLVSKIHAVEKAALASGLVENPSELTA